jgi:hypothetical protein
VRFVPTRHTRQLPLVLAPFDLAAREFLLTLHDLEPIELEVLYPRDMLEHRRIFAQIGELAKALHRSPEAVRAELLYKTGQFQVMGEMFGKVLISINSMSRHHMKDHELHTFWDDAREIIRTDLLPQVPDAAERDRLASTMLLSVGQTAAG